MNTLLNYLLGQVVKNDVFGYTAHPIKESQVTTRGDYMANLNISY
jgi:hypothetical protein